MFSAEQHRHHGDHSHGPGHHHHHHDNPYLRSTNKRDAGVRVTRLGLYVNVGMALSKGVGGWLFHSQALVADAAHALADLVSDVMTLSTIAVALRPPTPRYPLGFGKVESLGSLVVSALLLAGGVLLGQQALGALAGQFAPELGELWVGLWPGGGVEHVGQEHEHGHGHGLGLLGHAHTHQIPDMKAAWLAGGSILIKEYLYRITMKVAQERKSTVLASNAVHHRVDSLTSIVALVAIAGSNIIPGATWLDPVGSLLVAAMVVQAGWGNTRAAMQELCDRGLDAEVRASVLAQARRAVDDAPGVAVRGAQGVKAGQNYLVDVEVAAPAAWTLARLREVEEAVRERVGSKVRGVRRVRVRFVPADAAADAGEADFASEFIAADVSPRSSPEPEQSLQHEHAHTSGSAHDHGSEDARDRDQTARKR